jgi:TetR/AcrR family transcriptional repressor of nem operon
MAGRPKIYDEEKALDSAIEVFWKKGYENASAGDLLKAMGIGKGSFYLAYKGGKPELFEKSVTRVVNHHLQGFWDILENCPDPVQAINDFFFLLIDPSSPVGQRGCFFGNAVLQIEDKALKKMAASQLQLIGKAFTDALKRAKKAGTLTSSQSPEVLGLYLLNLWNGIHLTKMVEKDTAKLREMLKVNLSILNSKVKI